MGNVTFLKKVAENTLTINITDLERIKWEEIFESKKYLKVEANTGTDREQV